MESESDLTRSMIDELRSWDIQGDQMECESGVTRYFILGISKDIKLKVKVVVLEITLINFLLGISKDIKWQVKVVLLEISLTNFILWISKEIKW